jgi:NAD(P)-dependent dehydrogenase (short-subunit alcohol dehydrogenase family)
MQKLHNKVAFITGATGGIGAGIARAFAGAGAHLLITGRDEDKLNTLAQALGENILALPADITDEAQVIRLFDRLKERFGRLDLLVNNAGAFSGAPLEELSLETWSKVIATNLTAPMLCTREALKLMKPQRNGRIINIGSIAAMRVRPHTAPYAASKFGVDGLTQVTALEGREFGISCGVIRPGNVEVERLVEARQRNPEGVMKIEDFVDAVVAMAALPPHVNLYEMTVLPLDQPFLGRG